MPPQLEPVGNPFQSHRRLLHSGTTIIILSLSPFRRFANPLSRQQIKRLKPLDGFIVDRHTAEAVS